MSTLTVTGYQKRVSKEGKEFLTIEIQGGVEFLQSSQTGRFYATVRKSSMTATFSEDVAASLIGSQIPGKIIRAEVEPYNYTVPETGEVLLLSHRWLYAPDHGIPQLQPSF
jgi:hypothetical protein